MMESRTEIENLVIGGGLAGASVALQLAVGGREVLLIERESVASHKVCGEFLSPEAVSYLRQAGVDPASLGAASIHKLRLSCADRTVEAELPFTALSLSRRVLDDALLERAAQAGCTISRGTSVESLTPDGANWIIGSKPGGDRGGNCALHRASTVWLATGKHDLRGWSRSAGRQNDLVGFKMYWHLAPDQVRSLRGWMDLFLFPGGYGGLSLVENEVANLCLVVRRQDLRRAGNWDGVLAELQRKNVVMEHRLRGAEAKWGRPLAISPIPYGYMSEPSASFWPIGDQAAVIPSFTGDGMSIALHSAALAADMYLSGKSIANYQETLRAQIRVGMNLATAISRAMVTPAGRWISPWGLALLPDAMSWVARQTRIPERALAGLKCSGGFAQ